MNNSLHVFFISHLLAKSTSHMSARLNPNTQCLFCILFPYQVCPYTVWWLAAKLLKFHAFHRNSNCWLGRHGWGVPGIMGPRGMIRFDKGGQGLVRLGTGVLPLNQTTWKNQIGQQRMVLCRPSTLHLCIPSLFRGTVMEESQGTSASVTNMKGIHDINSKWRDMNVQVWLCCRWLPTSLRITTHLIYLPNQSKPPIGQPNVGSKARCGKTGATEARLMLKSLLDIPAEWWVRKGVGGWSLSRWGHAGNASVTTYLPGELHILLPRAFHSNPQSENSKWRILMNFGGAYHANALYQGAEIEENRKHQSHCSQQHLGSHRGPTRWALHHLHVGLSHCRIKLRRWYTLSQAPQISPANSTNITSCVGHIHGKTMENDGHMERHVQRIW